MSLKEALIVIAALMLITSAITSIFYFFGVDFSVYGNYLLWIWMLVIFFLILPSQKISRLI
jgi:hypothetical protein